jgi:Fur family transcriptional regulator, zinc uptake regulator
MNKQEMLALLHEQNFRLTREREALLDLFVKIGKVLTPAQLHEAAQAAQVRVGLTTVYRLVEVLTKVGLASPLLIEGVVHYAYCPGNHHHHFVCLSCHHVQDIYECPQFISLPSGCTVDQHKMDLFGTCAACEPS